MIQYIHKKKGGGDKEFTDHHDTSVKNVHTGWTMCGAEGLFSPTLHWICREQQQQREEGKKKRR